MNLHLLRVLVLIALPMCTTAQQGIDFMKFEKWSEVLEKAASESKLIFMDAYTTWCGPCKMMSANIFPQTEVGEFYNSHFVNVKVDMEKGEGLLLAKDYNVNAYPTLLFISADGKMVHKGLGYQNAESFIDLGRAATDPERQYGRLSELFASNQLSLDQHQTFAAAALQVGDQQAASKAALIWFNAQDDKLQPAIMEFVLEYTNEGPGSPLYDFVSNNRETFVAALGRETVDRPLKNALINTARASGSYSVETVRKQLGEVFPEEVASMYGMEYRMIYYTYFDRNNPELRDKATSEYFNTYLDQIEDWNALNSAAWAVYENEEATQQALEDALRWVKRSLDIELHFYNTDTAAALYYRLGKKEDALTWATKAIELGKKDGQDVSESEKLLEKVRQMN